MKKYLIGLAVTAALTVACFTPPSFAEGESPEQAAVAAALGETPAAAEEASAEEHSFTYVALGDSITAGNGLPDFKYNPARYGVDASPNFFGYSPDCFVAEVADELGLDRQHAINLGLPGLMSMDMVDLLRDGAMPGMNQLSGFCYAYPEYREYISKADVITIQIGSNDALVPFVVSIGNATDWKSEQFANSLVAGMFRNVDSNTMSLLSESLGKLSLTSEEMDALGYAIGEGMTECCDKGYADVTANLPQIISYVREINPDADIILIGYYNPVWIIPAWNSYFSRLNSYVKQLAEDEGLTYVDITWTWTGNDFHPSVSGYDYIGRQVAAAIKRQPNYAKYYG